jgi:diguanylate cyclase (GGDEF)-like protein/putative nucleotidyltransferase with HDIG domain
VTPGSPSSEPRWASGVSDEVRQLIAGAVVRAEPLPVLDATVRQLVAVLQDPSSSTAEAVTMVEHDPEFAAQLLRLANSAYYARRSTWKTVRQALAAVGRAAAVRLCLECATFQFLERAPGNGSASRGQLHLHAVTVATLAAETAQRAEIEIDSAHLAGLLHDIGKLIMPLAFAEERLDELASVVPHGTARTEAEWKAFGIDHAHAGALYVRDCGLDDELCTAIAYHHGGRSGVRVPSRLAAAVQVAEVLAMILGGAPPDTALLQEAASRLELPLDKLNEIALSATGLEVSVPEQPGISGHVAELERRANTDDLTEVASRHAWIDHARQRLVGTGSGTLLLCDVDRLKMVNDNHGHSAGEALLTQLAAILTQYGFAGRLGGDEFAVWLAPKSPAASTVVRTIRARTAEAFAWTQTDGQAAAVSIGTASAPADGTDLATLLEHADAALYVAKRLGGRRTPESATGGSRRRHRHTPR